MFGVMNLQSRFVIDYNAAPTKFGYDATAPSEGVVGPADRMSDRIANDKLGGHAKGHMNAMGSREPKMHANDNIYGRLDGTLKARPRRACGF